MVLVINTQGEGQELTIMVIFDRGSKLVQWAIVYLINGVGKIGQIYTGK